MKTTIELPDASFRQAKALAAAGGKTLKQFFTEALEAKLSGEGKSAASGKGDSPHWMGGFGALADLAEENAWVLRAIAEEFERIEPEDVG